MAMGRQMGWLRTRFSKATRKPPASKTLGTRGGWHSSGYGNKGRLAENGFLKNTGTVALLKKFERKGWLAENVCPKPTTKTNSSQQHERQTAEADSRAASRSSKDRQQRHTAASSRDR